MIYTYQTTIDPYDSAMRKDATYRHLKKLYKQEMTGAEIGLPLQTLYKFIDYLVCRLPELEPAQFNDPNKGLWEFWGWESAELVQHGVRSRNPVLDVKTANVAIDFGTSSTVVAYEDNGKAKLLRIGAKDYWEKEQPAHYENPTVLEFLDFRKMLVPWQNQAYRPLVDWDNVRCSHEAQHNFRNNSTDSSIVASVFNKIKQWALREGKTNRLLITDQLNKFEHLLAPLTLRMPVSGTLLTVSSEDPFDPMELYAWFLGMNINWRKRGIFVNYYMTFPVSYPRQVKDKILASFRRGLQRSLPASLVNTPEFRFSVEERASEPAAYAAIALAHLGIEPTATGVAYAVFDFGGGTTDFDFGFYRQPTPAEEQEEWEAVFEHFGAEGDKYLGGENLLENLAYRVFQHNIQACREAKIAFTKPADADDFPGCEMFLEKTQAATTNTLMLMTKLRPLWETGTLAPNTTNVVKMDLLNRNNDKVSCELSIPEKPLKAYLEDRIGLGIRNFFGAMHKAFADNLPEHIHILLAGNASRSELVGEFFADIAHVEESDNSAEGQQATKSFTQQILENVFGSQIPRMTVHPPLPIDESDVYKPTAKTGVALGLLRLCPGGVIKVVNNTSHAAQGEAPFSYYVGRIRQGHFAPGLCTGATYGEWQELGMPRERVFKLCYTQSPSAHSGTMKEGNTELRQRRIDLAGNGNGQKLYARAIGPAEIELCTAMTRPNPDAAQLENLQRISLD